MAEMNVYWHCFCHPRAPGHPQQHVFGSQQGSAYYPYTRRYIMIMLLMSIKAACSPHSHIAASQTLSALDITCYTDLVACAAITLPVTLFNTAILDSVAYVRTCLVLLVCGVFMGRSTWQFMMSARSLQILSLSFHQRTHFFNREIIFLRV